MQGLRRIHIGCCLQKAAVKYHYEGWSWFCMALTGTDTQYLIDMLEEMFGEGPLMDPEELATEEVKKAREEALKEEKKVAEVAGEHDPSVSTKYVIVWALPVPLEFGIDPELCPGVNPIMEPSVKKPGEKVTKFYYKCKIHNHQSQNQAVIPKCFGNHWSLLT